MPETEQMVPDFFIRESPIKLPIFPVRPSTGVLQASLGIRQSPRGRQRDRADLRAVRQAAALELLGKEPAVEILSQASSTSGSYRPSKAVRARW